MSSFLPESGFRRTKRDKGWIETKDLIKRGISAGRVLEVGPGPGYLGLEWLAHTQETFLTGVKYGTKLKAIRPGLISSINAAFTVGELKDLLA